MANPTYPSPSHDNTELSNQQAATLVINRFLATRNLAPLRRVTAWINKPVAQAVTAADIKAHWAQRHAVQLSGDAAAFERWQIAFNRKLEAWLNS